MLWDILYSETKINFLEMTDTYLCPKTRWIILSRCKVDLQMKPWFLREGKHHDIYWFSLRDKYHHGMYWLFLNTCWTTRWIGKMSVHTRWSWAEPDSFVNSDSIAATYCKHGTMPLVKPSQANKSMVWYDVSERDWEVFLGNKNRIVTNWLVFLFQ